MVETLSPSGAGKKKVAKKSSSKSPRASGMAAAIGNSLQQKRSARGSSDPDDPDHDPNAYCQKEFDGGLICDEPADANVHHLRGATGYHEFEAGKSDAQAVAGKSSTNGAASGSIPSTGDGVESALDACSASGGD